MTIQTIEMLRLKAEATLKELSTVRQAWKPGSSYSLAELDRAIQCLQRSKGARHD